MAIKVHSVIASISLILFYLYLINEVTLRETYSKYADDKKSYFIFSLQKVDIENLNSVTLKNY